MRHDIAIYGAGGHVKVILDILKANRVTVSTLIDDNPNIYRLREIPVIHSAEGISTLIIGIGNNRIRKRIAENVHCKFGTAIHPTAIISPYAEIGTGTVVMQGSIVQTESRIGHHCIINTGASIDHECRLDDFVHISPRCTLCGNVRIGEGAWIGAGTTVIPGVTIGKWSIIGAGSVVVNDIPDNVVAYGNPCRIIKSINNEYTHIFVSSPYVG